MKLGMIFANTMTFAGREGLVDLARGAEEAGFESLWTVEHVIYPDGYGSSYPYDASGKMAMAADTDLPDPLIWLTWVAAVTERIHLGTGILILPQRNPVVLAKELATLDSLSEGRLELGIGVGWLEEEFAALGVPFAGRGARTDEYVEVMRTLWDADHASFEGEHIRFSGASVNPKPTRGRVPIHIGGHSRKAAERAGRLGDGFFPGKGDLAELVDITRQTAADCGRDPDAIEITSGDAAVLGDDPVGAVEELRAKGVDRVVVPSFLFLKDTADALAGFGERVVAPCADI
ncbi:LLM class F420-dependent oxidoreductase [Iamia majanohamensis]|uniref:LLM class F420-dependent oxidoreductase n=1 Tax=Iamia majanohamensis TaxID=467976 RepID=A0AAE9Y9D5_9ACTN|nr:LLM class F420-dependent oxidoreductase [Iamia majanohamensis]WCO66948.1 LLM class F420-dependent oxidoreductase [Iamia majanohamensis]